MLALLSGASPRFCSSGPRVRLKPGKWRVKFDNVVDSTFIILLTSSPFTNPTEDIVQPVLLYHDQEFVIESTTLAQVDFNHRGSEAFVSILAQPVSGE